jgi:AcrR family transcriptional regulator
MGDTSLLKSKTTDQKETVTRSKSKKRDRSASEERLLQAAEDIFAKHGFKGATTRMIADKAKVNESLIGRYFDGKMGLLFALIETHIKEKVHEELLYPPQPNVRAELSALVDSMFIHHCQKDEEFFKIVLGQCLVDPKFLKRIREVAPINQYIPLVIARLEALKSQGLIDKDADLRTMMEVFDTYFHGAMFFDRILMGNDVNVIKTKLHVFINGISTALEPKAK